MDVQAPYRIALSVLTALFVLRVVGQIVVALWAPTWLPPMSQWHFVPYRILLPIQIVLIAVMIDFCVDPPPFGTIGVALSIVYAASMACRYVIRMVRRPDQRWFGGTIPIVFHFVLASFVFVLGVAHG
jgi:hypothetical protein